MGVPPKGTIVNFSATLNTDILTADMSNKPIVILGELTNVKFPDIFVEPLMSREYNRFGALLIPTEIIFVLPIWIFPPKEMSVTREA